MYDDGYTKKDLYSASSEIFKELNKNSKQLKNHTKYSIKSFLIKNENISQNNFSGNIKIWLIFNSVTGIFDYVIQIELPGNNKNKIRNIKKIILKSLNELDCDLIIINLEKLGIKYNPAVKRCDLFKWSFHIKDIPILKRELNISHLNNSPQNSGKTANSTQFLGKPAIFSKNLERKPNFNKINI